MAAPSIVTCAVGAYTVVSTNVTSVRVCPLDGNSYFWTYRLTAGGAPTLLNEAVTLTPGAGPFLTPLTFSAASDVYVWNAGPASGRVRVDA